MEGNCIDTVMKQRMLGAHVLRGAEKPRRAVKTQAKSTGVSALIPTFIYFIFCGGFDGCVYTVEHGACHVGHGL